MLNYLCLSIDGLSNGMLGAYGNTWIQTPSLDTLACQAALFDRFYASSLDLTNTLTECWQSLTPLMPNHHKTLLTDDAGVFLHEHAGLFDEKHRLETKQRVRPVRKIEGTQFYHNIAALAGLLSERPGQPFLFWAHFKGFRSFWDFPMSYRLRYQIDEDPAPYSGVTVPDIDTTNIIDPDVRQSIAEAYSGGVTVLDDALAGLFEFLRAEGLAQNTVLLFMSVRGFALGEHRYIGVNEDLYGENVHLPLIIWYPDDTRAGFRSQTLLQPGDLGKLIQQESLPEKPDELHSIIRIGNEAIVTPDWFMYRKPTHNELYVKPDDRWEVNDVANRCPEVLEQFFGDTQRAGGVSPPTPNG